MPQARYPRADEQVSNYWREDTESAREMARLMGELDDDDASSDGMKKASLPAIVRDDAAIGASALRRSRVGSNALHPLLIASPSTGARDDQHLEALQLDDLDDVPNVPAQLSPQGLISIAAADIDEAARSDAVVDLDLELLASIREAVIAERREQSLSAGDRNILVENFMARMSLTDGVQGAAPVDSQQSRLRFLSLPAPRERAALPAGAD
ncbi:hypothetical protein PINS_up010056 [Pythium insidiosum]|nr:hypothetical protein PINS_up010056 [Pythium insidiosum]